MGSLGNEKLIVVRCKRHHKIYTSFYQLIRYSKHTNIKHKFNVLENDLLAPLDSSTYLVSLHGFAYLHFKLKCLYLYIILRWLIHTQQKLKTELFIGIYYIMCTLNIF